MVCEGKKIVGPIFITKTRGRPCMPNDEIPGFFPVDGEPRTTEIRNISDISIDLNTPLERIPIPENTCEKAVLIKVIGNHNTIAISWVVDQQPTNIVRQTLCACAAETNNCLGGITGGDTTSAENQLKWWLTIFQSNSITDRYNLYLGDCTVNPIPNCPPTNACQEQTNFDFHKGYHKEGAINNIRFQKSGQAPVTYNATLTFFVGDIQETANECAPTT